MKLSELKTGEKASIVKVLGHGGFRKRIVEMGFVKGKVVESVLNAPLNDPIKYKIMGYEVSLRRSEANLIEVVSEEEASNYFRKAPETIIEDEEVRKAALSKRKRITVALVGNPNSGKTTLFNYASGGHEHVGNYSGVTVDSKEGNFEFKGYKITLVDLPGTYSISAYSPEERYVQDYITEKMPDVIINVVAASNIERNLYLTTQLIDMNVRTVVALNMYDELEKSGDILDYKNLGKLLGIPFVPTVARKKMGMDELFTTVIKLYEGSDVLNEEGILIPAAQDDNLLDDYHHEIEIAHQHGDGIQDSDLDGSHKIHETVRHIHINYGESIERSIYNFKKHLTVDPVLCAVFPARFWAIKLLEKDKDIEGFVSKASNADEIIRFRDDEIKQLEVELGEDVESYITDAKYGFIAGALKETYTESVKENKYERTSAIDSIVTNKYLGYPIFLLFMFIMFQATFWLGQYPMGWIEAGVGWLGDKVHDLMNPGPLRDLLVNGVIGGVGGVIVFLPNILILYFFISLMEDTGYMSRAAFIMDKIMHKMGLHGKSFIPLIMGFGCNVPAIMATRTIENRNSRMITILINPFMSCSARLPVYLLLSGAFFPNHAGLVLFGIYLTGIILAVIFARLFKRFLFPKDETPFVMELPPYRMPTVRSISIHTWQKGKQYLMKMGTVILFASIIIWFLGYYPRPEGNPEELTYAEQMQQQENSYIGKIGHFIEPAMRPLGFDWKISVALLSGVAAKEIVVSTLGVLYTGNPEEDFSSLSERLKTDTNSDGSLVFTPVVAICLMLFVLIYFPCIATITAIKHETGSWKWALFAAAYTLILAWLVAFAVYQIFGE
ncbi:ferrous iron transport protein B [Paludibacter sp. 221]|uniref:ferrous iron transport protein B n=1 Tax=Paludibacter sp. 221 TaxID=2302939 RepID=UPI0013D7F8AD|nr:ferrous iron transport protein B [Paludibacter sp. 221]